MNYPKYASHKEVSAAKIEAVDAGADGSLTIHLEGGFDNVIIPHDQMKHKPKPSAGWYLIVYADGYISFSPAKSFEDGYTKLEAATDESEQPHDLSDLEDEDEEDEEHEEALVSGNVPVPA